MQDEQRHKNNQLFHFKLPGLPDWGCTLTLQEVLGVIKIPSVLPLPFAPYFVTGISQWQSRIVTVIDMAAALCGISAKQSLWPSDSYHLVAQMLIDAQFELVAWPILVEAGVVLVPSRAPQALLPSNFTPPLIRTSFTVNHNSLVMLNLESLNTIAGGFAILEEG
jgi:chemotaxis signal transduction protein